MVDEGTRAYIERINILGNTRTRDYVIRREMDINEGDPYNRALLDRAERRIKNLNFFKTVKITTEPGSAPDRVVVNIDVVEQSTGDFSVMGGYSTAQGWMVRPRSPSAICWEPGDLPNYRRPMASTFALSSSITSSRIFSISGSAPASICSRRKRWLTAISPMVRNRSAAR